MSIADKARKLMFVGLLDEAVVRMDICGMTPAGGVMVLSTDVRIDLQSDVRAGRITRKALKPGYAALRAAARKHALKLIDPPPIPPLFRVATDGIARPV